DASHEFKQLAGDMMHRSDTGRSHVDLAWIGLGESNEIRNGLGRKRRIDLHHLGHAEDASDRRDVANEIEIELVVERRIDRVRGDDQDERMPVRGRTHHCFSGDIAAGARPVLNDEWLTETTGQPLPQQARSNVRPAAGGLSNDDPHWPRRIGLRPRYTRDRRERGSARGQMQEFATGKLHRASLPEERLADADYQRGNRRGRASEDATGDGVLAISAYVASLEP